MRVDLEAQIRNAPLVAVSIAFIIGWFLSGLFKRE
jgi:hypothetical protein